ncbi:hypothetical protein BT63DRAFT_458912 [Microthyrium microscopicum]|uniref:SUZ domain-containing protein n=1 Tax=Microthyrium microscopicum TaxID=703497 RepID=A0A6A6U056_9PEZI|nr:hypothetical protein BT63DRAFT_458912 [Microthyrium microscopicum]
MAPGPTDTAPKPSFAKVGNSHELSNSNQTVDIKQVAASSYHPLNEKVQSLPTTSDNPSTVPGRSRPVSPDGKSKQTEQPTLPESINPTVASSQLGEHDVPRRQSKTVAIPLRREDSSVKATANDDGSTQVSSEGSAKPPSFDTKSVASGTTFAMDEKESLRPDDSASMRAAIEEEEMFSAPGSVVTGSRVGSDLDGKPFREQLQEISYVGVLPPRGVIPSYQPQANLLSSTGSASQPIPAPLIASSNGVSGEIQPNMMPITPDEKLLEALQSQRDRVWVLKLEQDIIDFVGQSKEATLTLPQCNAFYRMLAHKLADYYQLDHTVVQAPGGVAVALSRTSFCRIPPPLSGLPSSASVADTPPLVAPARKIMRRPDDPRSSENTTAANSEGHSASVSDAGDSNEHGYNSGNKKSTPLTREEREKQYAEVRERIFGKDAEGADGVAPDENENSRSSSASGKKKTVKKQRNLSNDDFEPRSQFPGYYGQTYGPTNYQGEQQQYYYPQYPSMPPGQQFPMNSPTGPPMGYTQPYPGMMGPDPQSYGWTAQQQIPVQASGNNMNAYQQGPAQGYDIANHFQNAMQFQSGSNGGPMANKGPGSPMNGYAAQAMPGPPQASMNQWQQPQYDPNNQYNRQIYGSPQYQDRQMPGPATGQSSSPYAYNQYPNYPGPMHAPTGPQSQGYNNRPQFNPQIQAFVPRPMNMSPAQFPQYSMPNNNVPMPRPFPSSNPSSNGQGVFVGSPRPPSGPAAMSSHPYSNPNSKPSAHLTSKPQAIPDPISSSTPAEKPVLEITAKFGTPSHLPPRPPPPTNPEPHKYIEINRGVGGLPTYPGLPRMTANGFGGSPGNGSRSNSSQN